MDFASASRRMFQAHAVEAFGGRFHVPAAREYSCLFAWDSGYHALALRRLDPSLARAELEALYRINTADDGLLAHERPLPGAEARTKLVTEWLGPIYRPDGRSWLIDPPVPAYAAAQLHEAGGDTGLIEAADAHLLAVERARGLGDGLVILHPLESGADVSPLFDALVDTSSRRTLLTAHRGLSEALTARSWDLAAARASGHGFIVSDPIYCGWHLLALEALSDAFGRAGQAERVRRLDQRADRLARFMAETLWSEDLSLFVGWDHVGKRRLEVATLGGIIAAASRRMISAGLGARAAAAHLNPDHSRFWGPFGVAFNPLDGRPIDPKALLWRGDVVWGATQYWAWLVLDRLGMEDRAGLARRQLEALIARSGFREFYSAATGEGFGAGETDGFTWPALVLDMVRT